VKTQTRFFPSVQFPPHPLITPPKPPLMNEYRSVTSSKRHYVDSALVKPTLFLLSATFSVTSFSPSCIASDLFTDDTQVVKLA